MNMPIWGRARSFRSILMTRPNRSTYCFWQWFDCWWHKEKVVAMARAADWNSARDVHFGVRARGARNLTDWRTSKRTRRGGGRAWHTAPLNVLQRRADSRSVSALGCGHTALAADRAPEQQPLHLAAAFTLLTENTKGTVRTQSHVRIRSVSSLSCTKSDKFSFNGAGNES